MGLRDRLAVTLIIAIIGGVGAVATPAQADTGDGLITGSGTWTDDWWDEGPLSTTANSHSNAVAMWQAILWADGYMAYGDIDCWFGSGTASLTRSWQTNHGIGVDGAVGRQTLKKASTWLRAGSNGQIVYEGTSGRYVTFRRGFDGTWWEMYMGNTLGWLWYDTVTFPACQ